MNVFPPGQGLKSRDDAVVIRAIQFLTAVEIIVGARYIVPLRVDELFVAQVQALGDSQIALVVRFAQVG